MKTYQDFNIEVTPGTAGSEVNTTCPKCSPQRKNKKAKCLSVNVEKAVWYCNHCSWTGSLAGKESHYPPAWNKPEFRKAPTVPKSPLSAKAAEWFAARKINPAAIERNGITSASVYMPQLDDHAEAIVFPYVRGGEVVNHKYRAPGKAFRMDTGAERILFKLDDVQAECLVICEGELDALAIETAGITSCVSVPDGAPAVSAKDYSSKFTFLDSAAETLAPVKKIILAVDNDAPGKLLEDELSRRLGRERCWRVAWPEGCKDANDVLIKFSADVLRFFIDNAEPYPIEGVFTALGESEKVFALYRNGLERGQKTGWPRLDQFFTVRPGEFTVVSGVPGSGKSNWLDALAVNLARMHGWSFGVFSPENQPIEDHIARIVEKFVGEPFSDGPTQRMDEGEVKHGLEWANEHFFWMLPNDEASWGIEWILQRARELVARHGIRGLIIDPWNELESQRSNHETETEYVSRVLRVVRQFGRRNGVHVFLVAHPTKMYRDKESGKYPVPTLYDISGSAHFRNKADNGIVIWRDLSETGGVEVDVHVQKIRFRQIGKLGKATLHYDRPTACYVDPSVTTTYERVGNGN